MPRAKQRVNVTDRVMSTLAGSVGVLFRLQVSLENRFEDDHCGHLHDTIFDRWNAQRSLFAVRLGDPDPTDRTHAIRFLPEFILQFVQPPFHTVRFDILERHSVRPRCPAVDAAAANVRTRECPIDTACRTVDETGSRAISSL